MDTHSRLRQRFRRAVIVVVTKAYRSIGHILIMEKLELSFLYRNLRGTSHQCSILNCIEFGKFESAASVIIPHLSFRSCSALRSLAKLASPALKTFRRPADRLPCPRLEAQRAGWLSPQPAWTTKSFFDIWYGG